jgi:ELWxxDGT repeat protein
MINEDIERVDMLLRCGRKMVSAISIRKMLSSIVGNTCSRRASRRSRSVAVEPLESRALLAASVGVLRDIKTGAPSSAFPAGQSTEFVSFGSWWYFTADDGTLGSELWRTDGTEANTQLFLDVRTGVAGSFPSDIYAANGKLYFTATSPAGVRSLYATDGTVSGTSLLSANQVGRVIGTVDATTYFYRSGRMAGSRSFCVRGRSLPHRPSPLRRQTPHHSAPHFHGMRFPKLLATRSGFETFQPIKIP